MRLILTLTGSAAAALSEKDKMKTLSMGSLSIGRGAGNDWVLPDPERSLSKTHCSVALEGDRVILTDTSTNGLFINNASQATERDSRLALTNGDKVRLGNYEIAITLTDTPAAAPDRALATDLGMDYEPVVPGSMAFPSTGAPATPSGPLNVDPLDDPLGRPARDPAFQHAMAPVAVPSRGIDPFDQAQGDAHRAGGIGPDDDLFQGRAQSSEWQGASRPDHTPVVSQAVPAMRIAAAPTSGEIDFDALIGDLSGQGGAFTQKPDAPSAFAQPASFAQSAPSAFAQPDTHARPDPFADTPPARPFAQPPSADFQQPPDPLAPRAEPQAFAQPGPAAFAPPDPFAEPAAAPQSSRPAVVGSPSAIAQPAFAEPASVQPVTARPAAPANPFAEADEAAPMPVTADGAAPRLAEPPAPATQPPPATSAPAQAVTHAGSDAIAAFRAFLEGAGVADQIIDDGDPEDALRAAGAVFRALTEGLREVLISRTAIKSEMRIEQTMIASHGNNGLKFSITPEDAVAALLTRKRRGYMAPLDAAKEALSDVKSHEIAVMAGVQTALMSLLRRFDPDELEKRLTVGGLGALLPGARKSRYWDGFRQIYGDITREAEDDFQSVFGRSFAKAYSAQARKD